MQFEKKRSKLGDCDLIVNFLAIVPLLPVRVQFNFSSLLHFSDVDQNHTKTVSHSNLPFIYKAYPLTHVRTYTHTHVHVPTHSHTNKDLMTVSEIITRLACSTVGLKLTPCPQTHTPIHIHTTSRALSSGPYDQPSMNTKDCGD